MFGPGAEEKPFGVPHLRAALDVDRNQDVPGLDLAFIAARFDLGEPHLDQSPGDPAGPAARADVVHRANRGPAAT